MEQDSDKKKLKVTGSNGVCITPGNVVWAKTACQVWWPAEVCSCYFHVVSQYVGDLFVFYTVSVHVPEFVESCEYSLFIRELALYSFIFVDFLLSGCQSACPSFLLSSSFWAISYLHTIKSAKLPNETKLFC